jgi:hypothetical protein
MINKIDRSQYNIVEKPVQMKSHINRIIHLTPKLTEEEYRKVKKQIGSELYDIFKKYV